MQRQWTPIKEYSDILFEYFEGIAKITINRPQVRNAFTPTTVAQMSEALVICRQRNDIRVVVLTGAGDKAFCSGGDMHVKGIGGYIDPTGVPRLNVLDVQKQIRSLPKPVIAMVNGFADRRRPCASSRLRPLCCERECRVRTDRTPRRLLRCRVRGELSRPLRRTKESA